MILSDKTKNWSYDDGDRLYPYYHPDDVKQFIKELLSGEKAGDCICCMKWRREIKKLAGEKLI